MSKRRSNKKSSGFTKAEIAEINQTSKELGIRYSNRTLLGYWNDSRLYEDLRVKRIEQMYEECKTFAQRKSHAQLYLQIEGDIATYSKELLYDVPVQIITDLRPTRCNPNPEQMIISCSITDKNIQKDEIMEMDANCLLTVSMDRRRIRRNIFRIISYMGDKKKYEPVLYGDEVMFTVNDTGNDKILYFRTDVPNTDSMNEEQGRLFIELFEGKDSYCKYKFLNPEVHLRRFTNQKPVPANARVTIAHTLTNKLISFDPERILDTISGKETHVVSYTFRYRNGSLTDNSYWIFLTKTLGEETREADRQEKEAEIKAIEDAEFHAYRDYKCRAYRGNLGTCVDPVYPKEHYLENP